MGAVNAVFAAEVVQSYKENTPKSHKKKKKSMVILSGNLLCMTYRRFFFSQCPGFFTLETVGHGTKR